VSDHFSGPRAIAGPLCDICDVYAFPSPERNGHLVLVMNVLPMATPSSFFSDAIVCRFRLRTVSIAGTGSASSFAFDDEEVAIDCSFDPPEPKGTMTAQTGTCEPYDSETVRLLVHDAKGSAGNGVRIFAGLRSDPFFIDLPAIQSAMKTGRLAFSDPGVNSLAGANVLGIVAEVELTRLMPSAKTPLLAAALETIAAGKLPIRLERVGRPEVKNIFLGPKDKDRVNRDIDLRDLYNLEDAFHVGPDYRRAYRARLNANLSYLDGLNGRIDWPPDSTEAHPLTELLLHDFLVVDTSKPFQEGSFFEVEQAMLADRPHQSCGGRPLNDDVMDRIYTLLIGGSKGPPISDHVDMATVPADAAFPYLAAPNPMLSAPTGGGSDPSNGGGHSCDHQHHHFGRPGW